MSSTKYGIVMKRAILRVPSSNAPSADAPSETEPGGVRRTTSRPGALCNARAATAPSSRSRGSGVYLLAADRHVRGISADPKRGGERERPGFLAVHAVDPSHARHPRHPRQQLLSVRVRAEFRQLINLEAHLLRL